MPGTHFRAIIIRTGIVGLVTTDIISGKQIIATS